MRKKTTPTPARDYAAEFAAQKCITKKEAQKLRPGSIIEVKFKDAPNVRALVVARPERNIGLNILVQIVLKDGYNPVNIEHPQIVRVHPINAFSLLTDLS